MNTMNTNNNLNTQDYVCKKCHYMWKSRVKVPVACPSCKNYHWAKENSYKKETNELDIQLKGGNTK